MNTLKPQSYKILNTESLEGVIVPPSSKSTSIRAVLAAAIGGGASEVANVAHNFNTKAMIDCCQSLGAEFSSRDSLLFVKGIDYQNIRENIKLNPQNSGVVLRLLLGVIAGKNNITIETEYHESLGSRANIELLDALQYLGASISYQGDEGTLPIEMQGGEIHGGKVKVSGRRSSQFLSGLLYLGSVLNQDLEIAVCDELKSKPMIHTTINILKAGGVNVEVSEDMMSYFISGNDIIKPAKYIVGSDPASTSALLAVASAVESEVVLDKYYEEEMGNGVVLDTLKKMGVDITQTGSQVSVKGGGDLLACDFDGSQAPDSVLPLAALACFAKGTSRFYNIEHIRFKECDRISDFRKELLKAGANVDETQTELIVHGKPEGIKGGVEIDSNYDHGVIMALTALGLKSKEGVTIPNAQYVGQTYPNFFDDIAALGAKVTQF